MESCLHPCHGRHLLEPHCREATGKPDLLNEIRCWAEKVAELGRPHFGEFATRLEEVHDAIQRGCGNPNCGCTPCLCKSCDCSREPVAAGTKEVEWNSEIRSQVLSQLERMISVLRCEDSCFTSWQAACRNLDEICLLIPQAKTTGC